jgi:hypothetical protein
LAFFQIIYYVKTSALSTWVCITQVYIQRYVQSCAGSYKFAYESVTFNTHQKQWPSTYILKGFVMLLT